MTREEFIPLIGKNIIVDYPFGRELQKWNLKNFSYDEKTGCIKHNRLDRLNVDVFIRNARNPHTGDKATHG